MNLLLMKKKYKIKFNNSNKIKALIRHYLIFLNLIIIMKKIILFQIKEL